MYGEIITEMILKNKIISLPLVKLSLYEDA